MEGRRSYPLLFAVPATAVLEGVQTRDEDGDAADRVRERLKHQGSLQLGCSGLLLQQLLQRVFQSLRQAGKAPRTHSKGARTIRKSGDLTIFKTPADRRKESRSKMSEARLLKYHKRVVSIFSF